MIVQSVYLDSLEAKAEIVDALSGVPDSGDTRLVDNFHLIPI